MPGVNRESIMTVDEATYARELARERYHAMLCDDAYDEADTDSACPAAQREGALAAIAWRQAVSFVMTCRWMFENNVG